MNRKLCSIAVAIGAMSLFSMGTMVQKAHAALLLVSPSSVNVSAGNIFTVNVNVNSQGISINNASTILNFPPDLIEVVSIDKEDSIFNLWVQEPAFSNSAGTIDFNGGVPNPGYTGTNGQIISIVFRAKKTGSASIIFSSPSVLANDGNGTDVLRGENTATVQIGAASSQATATVAAPNGLPPMPIITSTTDPDQNAWYSGSSATFNWSIPQGITSLQTLLGESSTSIPSVTYNSFISQKTVDDLSDGVFYFDLRYMNAAGWGPVGRYKIQSDSTPPEPFTPTVAYEGNVGKVTLDAQDALSGIDSYGLAIDTGSTSLVEESSLPDNQWVLPTLNAGEHVLIVTAYDKAGNHTEASVNFTSPPITAPTAEVSPEQIVEGQTLSISGDAGYPNANVSVFVQPEGQPIKTYFVTASDTGSYSLTTDPVKSTGTTYVWAQTVFSAAIMSPLSEKIPVTVKNTAFVQVTNSITSILLVTVPVVILLILLIMGLYIGWHKFFGLRKKISRDAQTAAADIHKAMMLLRDELGRQLDSLQTVRKERELNKKEEKIFRELQKNIDSVDEFIEKRLKKFKGL